MEPAKKAAKKQKKEKRAAGEASLPRVSVHPYTSVALGEGFAKKSAAVSLSFQELQVGGRKSTSSPALAPTEGAAAEQRLLSTLFRGLSAAAPPSSQRIFDRFPAEHISPVAISISLGLHRHQLTHSEACHQLLRGFRALVAQLNLKREGRAALAQKIAVTRGVIELHNVLDAVLGNVLGFLAARVEELPAEPGEEDRAALLAALDNYLDRRFTMAEALLVEYCVKMIVEGDSVFVCNASPILERVLVEAHAAGTRYSLTVLGSPALPRNLRFAQSLNRAGVPVLFTHLNNLPFFIDRASKVFLKGLNVFGDGSVRAAAGSAALALFAQQRRKPVYVVTRTLSFCEESPVDALELNRLESFPVASRAQQLLYDLVPARQVSLLLTEIGPVPPSSVPAVAREGRAGGRWQ